MIDAKAERRFYNKVAPIMDDRGCHEWFGYISATGYGRFNVNGEIKAAHRVSFEIEYGRKPSLTIDHLCRNRSCVNPAHLDDVTQGENTLRGLTIVAAFAKRSACKYGHVFDAANTRLRKGRGRICIACVTARNTRAYEQRKGIA